MLKKLLLLVMTLTLLFIFTACSEKDSTSNDGDTPEPPTLAQTVDMVFAVPDSAALVDYVSEQVEYNGALVDGYSLEQFLNFDRENLPELEYAYEIVSDDYSPRDGGNPELTWEQFETGFLLPSEDYRIFFPSDDIANAYNVKWPKYINLYRTVIVVDADGTNIPFQTGAIETENVTYTSTNSGNSYTGPGFAVTNLISEYVTENPENHEYVFTASDDYSQTCNWEVLQKAWWLTEKNKAVFLDTEGIELQSSFKFLIRLELVELP
jgi:hypothetical protein